MRALVKPDATPGRLEVTDIAAPTPGTGDVLIRVERVGLCGTDVGIQHWAPGLVREYAPSLPHILGHEFSGTVVEQGPGGAEDLRGRRVTVNPHLSCMTCEYCRRGKPNICVRRPILGCHVAGGAAEFVSVRSSNLHPLPDDLSFELGALVEPTSVALHAVERAGLADGMSVGVVGAGPIGILCGLVLQALGHAPVLAGTPEDAERLETAARRGLRTTDEPLAGLDVVIEAAGSTSGVQSALRAANPDGRVVVVSLPHHEIPLDVASLVFRELSVIGSRAYTPDVWPRAISLISGSRELFDGLVSAVYPLERWHDALATVASREAMKVQLQVT